MNKLSIGLLALLLAACGRDSSSSSSPAIPADKELEARVDKIVGDMSLDEKIGQMCQVTSEVVMTDSLIDGHFELDMAAVDTVFGVYKVGSVLNTPAPGAVAPEVWNRIISEIQEASVKMTGAPTVYGVDSNHGASYTAGATIFPQEINMAASLNRDLVTEGAAVCAYESRACGISWVFNPTLDLGRNPVWPRMWESFGEDPYINGAMGAAMVRGYQGSDPNHLGLDNVAACIKHYMGYGNPVTGKDRTPSSIALPDMRERYFYAFKEAIRAGALSLMVNSGINCGIPFHANHELLTVWLKEQLGWDGMIVTDWADIHNLWKRDKIAENYKEAIKLSINAGVDMSMTPYDVEFCTLLKELVEEGEVPMSRIDDAAKRVVRLKLRLGLFDHPIAPLADYPRFASKEHEAKALEMAVQSEILLKNDNNILPIAEGKRILVAGPNANSMRPLNGGWSYMWQGSDNPTFHEQYNTIYEALSARFGASNVVLEKGMDYVENSNKWEAEENLRIDRAVAAARGVDIIIACIGENSYTETPGNTNDLTISANQSALVKALAATGKPIVLVLNEGRPRIIREIEGLASAVVDILLPGNYGGDALAQLLAGDRNFSGKLPFSYPKWVHGFATYDHKPSEEMSAMSGAYNYSAAIDLQWPFGYGLSYTTFEYSGIKIDKSEFSPADELTISVEVKNTGNREGMESLILYSSDLVASITPDVKRVRGFEKISLQPGESRRVSFTIPASDLAFVNPEGKWTLEKGDFTFTIGTETIGATCNTTKVWPGANI